MTAGRSSAGSGRPDGPTVQQTLEDAIARMTAEPVAVHGAGRTDAGVHALAMEAHVDIAKPLTPHRLREGLNALVRPQPISVLDVEPVADDWHARFSCTGRRYRYRILNRRAPPAVDKGRVWHIPSPLDARRDARRRRACWSDVTISPPSARSIASRKARSRRSTGSRSAASARRSTSRPTARSFLHHQVRSMVGCLAMVGRGQWMAEDIAALEARDRAALGLNAPPQGLYFVAASYP